MVKVMASENKGSEFDTQLPQLSGKDLNTIEAWGR